MQVYSTEHEEPIKAGCCNYRVSKTYKIAESEEQAEEEDGLCSDCLLELLIESDYKLEQG